MSEAGGGVVIRQQLHACLYAWAPVAPRARLPPASPAPSSATPSARTACQPASPARHDLTQWVHEQADAPRCGMPTVAAPPRPDHSHPGQGRALLMFSDCRWGGLDALCSLKQRPPAREGGKTLTSTHTSLPRLPRLPTDLSQPTTLFIPATLPHACLVSPALHPPPTLHPPAKTLFWPAWPRQPSQPASRLHVA